MAFHGCVAYFTQEVMKGQLSLAVGGLGGELLDLLDLLSLRLRFPVVMENFGCVANFAQKIMQEP
jgi:hypothetical protein